MYSPKLAQNRDGGLVGRHPSASQQHTAVRTSSAENIGSSSVSRVFEGMLKTTTETGDIGLFSIKSSRVSQQIGPPRKIYHPPQPILRHAQLRDDNCNMASNGQDASSDVLSVQDAASQSSVSQSSDMNHARYRSCSATYSSSTVSNRRSYASLTRHVGENGSIQRPQSPLAYPSPRVRRPPRPCFPVMVEGERASYIARPELERPLYEHGHRILSTPPAYFSRQQRPPAPSHRYYGNWSVPSLLDQPLPQHQISNPNLRRSSVPILNGWEHRSGLSPGDVSPARSNLSLSSTGDVQPKISPQLVQTTPAKSHSSLPVYYDYSEDFSPNDYPDPEVPTQSQQLPNDKSVLDGQQVKVDCLEIESHDNPAVMRRSQNIFSTQSPIPGHRGSAVKKSTLDNQPGDIQALAATNFQSNTGTVIGGASSNNECIQQSILDRARNFSQIMDGKATHAISPSIGTTENPGFALNEANRKGSSSDHNYVLTAESCDSEVIFVDAIESPLIDYNERTIEGTQRGLSKLSTACPDIPSNREGTNGHYGPLIPVMDKERRGDKSEIHGLRGNAIMDTTAIFGSGPQRDFNTSDRLDEVMACHSGYPTVMEHALSNKIESELDSDPLRFKGTAEPLRSYSLQFNSQGRCKQRQQPKILSSHNPDSPLNQESIAARDEDQKTEYSSDSSQPLRKRLSYLQLSVPRENGSPECSSILSCEDCHPFTCQNLDIDSGNELTHFNGGNLLKFKLKITRPSDSILGTVRVNRTSVDSNAFTALNLQDPRDLFTPSPKLDSIFRRPSEDINASRQTPSLCSQTGEPKLVSGPILNHLSGHKPQKSAPSNSLTLATTTNLLYPTDEQSFFSDDSSHMEGKRYLRKTLSNLRARVAVPYASKNGTHSYDGAQSCEDIIWRDENSREVSTLPAENSAPLQMSSQAGRRSRLRERIHVRRLRKIVSGWVKEAKSVLASRVRPGLKSYRRSSVNNNGS